MAKRDFHIAVVTSNAAMIAELITNGRDINELDAVRYSILGPWSVLILWFDHLVRMATRHYFVRYALRMKIWLSSCFDLEQTL